MRRDTHEANMVSDVFKLQKEAEREYFTNTKSTMLMFLGINFDTDVQF